MKNENIIVGGGLAGLIAATELARQGSKVTLFEQTGHLGGRAATTRREGFDLNLGPHALYAEGALHNTLRGFGLAISAKPPRLGEGSYLVSAGKKFRFPAGIGGLIRTGALTFGEKARAARLFGLVTGNTPPGDGSAADWLDRARASGKPRRLMETFLTLATYSKDLNRLSAAAGLGQIRSAFRHGVLYIDHGWETMIDGLQSKARSAGVVIETSKEVARAGSRCVRLSDGTQFQPAGIVLAVPPDTVRRLTSRPLPPMTPVRAAVLDIGLTSLPPGAAGFALALDPALYFSVHSKSAALAPEGSAVVHIAKYLDSDETGTREEVERLADLLMPGWRERVAHSRFLPNLTVSHAISDGRRHEVDALGLNGVAIAGDWVGNSGILGDAAASSALGAAQWLQSR